MGIGEAEHHVVAASREGRRDRCKGVLPAAQQCAQAANRGAGHSTHARRQPVPVAQRLEDSTELRESLGLQNLDAQKWLLPTKRGPESSHHLWLEAFHIDLDQLQVCKLDVGCQLVPRDDVEVPDGIDRIDRARAKVSGADFGQTPAGYAIT
jgi:hypothetical protein